MAVERRVSGGGVIRDTLMRVQSGHLVLTREIVWGREADTVGRLIFSSAP